MSKSKNTTQPSLEELYTTDNLTLLKRAITKLTNKQDYKTIKARSGGISIILNMMIIIIV